MNPSPHSEHCCDFTSGIQIGFVRWLKLFTCSLHGFLHRYSLRPQLFESASHELVDWIHGTVFRCWSSRCRCWGWRRLRRWWIQISTRFFVYLPVFFLAFNVMVIHAFAARACFHFDVIASLIFEGSLSAVGAGFFFWRHSTVSFLCDDHTLCLYAHIDARISTPRCFSALWWNRMKNRVRQWRCSRC